MEKETACPICGRDMGHYTDKCDPCWQLENGLCFLQHCPVGEIEALRRLGLRKIEEDR